MTAYTKSKLPKLVNARIDGESKEAILLPPEIKTVITRTQQLTEDLLEDTRQHYHQSLGITYHASAEQAVEATQRQNLLVAVVGFALATAGTLLTPVFYVPSIG